MKVLNRGIKLCGQTEVIDTVACNVLERNVSDLITRLTAASVSLTSAKFAVGCVLTHETTGHVYVNQGTVASPTWNDIGAIAASEIALAEGSVLVGNSSGVSAALSAKADKAIIVGNGTTVTAVQMSGDVTIGNTGVTAIGESKVTAAMLATAIAPSHVVKFAGSHAYGGGGTSDAKTIAGVASTDVVVATIRSKTNAGYLDKAVPTTDTVTFTFSADPGASTVVDYVVFRAIA